MAYEGFQLLTYDYKDIGNPQRTLPFAVISAILVVIVVYILVALGTALMIGANQIIQYKEVALAITGQSTLDTFRRFLAGSPLLSTTIYIPAITTVTGFTYRGLTPYKITPMSSVHKTLQWIC